jgi:phage-related protein
MTGPIQRAYVDIIPQMSNFGSKLRTQVRESVSTSTRDLGHLNARVTESVAHTEREHAGMFTRMKEQFKELAAFALPAIGAVEGLKFIKESVAAAREEQKQLAQTGAVLKSTGEAAHVTADEVENLAKQQSIHTGITQTQIRANENLLLTFTDVRNEVGKGNDIFDQATKAVLDMSVALKEDGKAASIQLGKALNDPVKGYTALKRVGVTFTDQQKEQIKTMVKAGNIVGAQKVILHELSKEFGGSAAAQATASDKSKAAWEAFRVELGDKLLPIIDKVETWITQHIIPALLKLFDETGKGKGPLATIISVVKAFFNAIVPLGKELLNLAQQAWPKVKEALETAVVWFGKIATFIKTHETLVRTLTVAVLAFWAAWKGYKIILLVRDAVIALNLAMDANPIGLVVAAIAALAAGFIYAYNHSETFRQIVLTVLHLLKQWFNDVWTFLKKWGPLILGVLLPVIGIPLLIWKHWKQIKGFFMSVWNDVYGFIKSVPARMLQYGKDIINGLWAGLKFVWHLAWVWFVGIPRFIIGLFVNAVNWLYRAGRSILAGLWQGLRDLFDSIRTWFLALPGRIKSYLRNADHWLYSHGRAIITGMFSGIKSLFTEVVNWFKDLPHKILHALGIASPPKWAISAGKWIMHGLKHGLAGSAGAVKGFFGNLAKEFEQGMGFLYGSGGGKSIDGLIGVLKSAGGIGNILSGLGGTVTGGMISPGARTVAAWAAQAVKIAGFPTDWIPAIVRRAMFESSGNPFAINLTDANARAGHPSKGLMQTIDSTFNAYAMRGHHNIWNAVDNIIAAIRYIRANYGSISAIDPPVKGYKTGAWRIPSDQFAFLHRNEMVLPDKIASVVRRSLSSGSSAMDEDMLARAIARAFAGLMIRFDADGVARLVTKQQGIHAVKGSHR